MALKRAFRMGPTPTPPPSPHISVLSKAPKVKAQDTMNSTKPRKACVNCYQKKVRCNWTEASPVCSYCLNHGLECSLPDPAQPPQRIAVKDKLAEIDARLRRLEEESRGSARSTPGPYPVNHKPSIHATTTFAEDPSLVSQDWNSLEGLPNFGPPLVSNTPVDNSSRLINISNDISRATAIVDGQEVPGEVLIPLPEEESHPGSVWDASDDSRSSGSRQSIKRFRGDTTPWNVLADGTAASIGLANDEFNETIARLAEEDRSTPAVSGVYYDFLKELPPLTKDLILEYASQYEREAPFPVVYWVDFRQVIERGLSTKRWSHWGEVVCVLLYVAFGSVHLRVSMPHCDCEIYFHKAWSLLPHLLMEQDLWALKALTLMVHYLQGGSLPEQCYTLLGSASRMAISLGFHRKYYDRAYSPIEEEEGKRCWWLCYILEKTFALVLGRPSTNVDAFDAEIPRPFFSLNDIVPTFTVRDGNLVKNSDPNDEEAVSFYIDLIEVVRTREDIRRVTPVNGLVQGHSGAKHESIAHILAYWRAVSQLHRPLDFDTSKPASLRAIITDLCYYNSIISLDRYLKKDFEKTMSNESIQSARATLRLVADSGSNGMTMCIWMWLYYAFSSAVVLFLDVIHNPLHSEATLNLALISDLENLCTPLSGFSPGAKRVMDVSREMNKAAFEMIKSRAKRKAREDLESVTGMQGRFKQRRTQDPESSLSAGERIPRAEAGEGEARTGSPHSRSDQHSFNAFPTNFSWDDWDQWLNEAAL